MTTGLEWKNSYFELLSGYLKDENEFSLYSASLLGKELIEKGVTPDEVIEAHLTIFKQIISNSTYAEWVPYIYKSFNLLIELMTVFGITLKEHLELKEEFKKALATQVAYKRLKFYVDEVEFVTKRLASLNEELDQRVIELSSLQKISKAINSFLEFDHLLESITVSLNEIIDCNFCTIMLLDSKQKLQLKKAVVKGQHKSSEQQLELHTVAGEWAIRYRETCFVSDLCNDTRFKTNNLAIHSLLAVPMIVEKEVLGVITIDNTKPASFTDDSSRIMSIIAAQAGIAIKNACTYEEIKKVSMTDGLTGAYNHRYFYERLKTEVDWARHYNLSLSLLMLDLDNFKDYNDTFGHVAGDQLLQNVTEILRRCSRQDDIIARYGGEEFAVILVAVDINTALKVAERIRQEIMNQTLIGENQGKKLTTVSIGVATFPNHAENAKQLVDCADKALYQSKKAGKNRVSISIVAPVVKT